MLHRLRRVRKMTYVLWAWCILIIVWAANVPSANDCHDLSATACQTSSGLGVLFVLFIGFVGFLFFALIWFMSRPRVQR
jgi:hypothetical protein